MANTTPQQPLNLTGGHESSHGAPKMITGTSGGTTTLEKNDRFVIVTPPASGTHTITVPPYSDWINDFLTIIADATSGGDVTVVDQNATDLVGDNLTADNDVVVLGNVWGRKTFVLHDVTT